MRSRPARALWLAAIALALAAAFHRAASVPPWPEFQVGPDRPAPPLDASGASHAFASSRSTPSVHSATAVELEDGRVRAFWYGGTREGAKDVAIYSAVFDPALESWGPEEKVVDRESTRDDLGRYIRKLGNPVAARDARGKLWLFYVSVSVGGWSGSAVNVKTSDDEGATWTASRRLVTSPLLNVSTLVKGPAVFYADGSLGLPVYHELLGKLGELLRIDAEGHVVDKTRISSGRTSLQPVVVPLTAREGVALLRRSGSSPARVLRATTRDAGERWSELAPTNLPNPDAAVAAIRVEGDLLVAFNDSEADRSSLELARSPDGGRTFDRICDLPAPDADPKAGRFAYPWLLQTRSGDVHLLYTWQRERITHVWFRR